MNPDIIEQLKNTIEQMEKSHHIEILKILKKYSCIRLNENKSGVFVNMMSLPQETVDEITKYIDYIKEQEKTIFDFENQQDNMRTQQQQE